MRRLADFIGAPGFVRWAGGKAIMKAARRRWCCAAISADAAGAIHESISPEHFADLGMTTGTSSPEEFDAYIKSGIARWSQVIKKANVQPMD